MTARNRGFPPPIREAIMNRDKYRCVRCGRDLSTLTYGNIHHRRPRHMGGSKRADTNQAANGILLCGTGTSGCHGWIETHREDARQNGWLVSGWDDPTTIPVTYPNGTRYLLTPDGQKDPAA